jgi:hypothetical protein
MAADPSSPPTLLSSVSWSFHRSRYKDLPSFVRAVERLHAEAWGAPPPWDPEAVVLPLPVVRVHYDERGPEIALRSPGAGGFTAAGLLLALHEAMRASLEQAQDHYFHELSLVEPARPMRPPLYEVKTAYWLGNDAERPRGPLPKEVMRRVLWSFQESRPKDRAAFAERVRRYEEEIRPEGERAWEPEALVLPAPVIGVGYWVAPQQRDRSVVLRSAAPEGFTAADLLHQIHGDAAPRLARDDHHFFEGLSLGREPTKTSPPWYHILLGS